jgi:hypothetical protein
MVSIFDLSRGNLLKFSCPKYDNLDPIDKMGLDNADSRISERCGCQSRIRRLRHVIDELEIVVDL